MAERQLNLYSTFSYTEAYWNLSDEDRKAVRSHIAEGSRELADVSYLYTVYPTRSDTDFMIWSAWQLEDTNTVAKVMSQFVVISDSWRKFISPVQSLWGITKVSTYARGKSEQDVDPFDGKRTPYFVLYPFSKSKEWYLMSMDARQGQMNEHIKLGKQYPEIKQLLIYSFGLQDQEFVVSYETGDIAQFSDLVYALRSTEARRATSLDTPIIAGIYQTVESFVR